MILLWIDLYFMNKDKLDQKLNVDYFFDDVDVFVCPICQGEIEINNRNIKCIGCGRIYKIDDGIPKFFVLNDVNGIEEDNVTEKVKNFYEKTPFPNYEDFEDITTLTQKAQKSFFADLLDRQIPFGSKVLEVGCGTGQLSNFLGISNRYIFGTDICFNSLKLGQDF